ncbi:MAG: DUF3419 family protein [Planctomycetes bacterium]|nr:DUF3419 family protein [Planctomycetota bacterium]
MIASGGCTAAYLCAQGTIASLDLVDPNPYQLELTKRKLDLLQCEERGARVSALGHDCPSKHKGLDYKGRYETLFQALQKGLSPHQGLVRALFTTPTLEDQRALLDSCPEFIESLRRSIQETMALPNLVALFGQSATQNPARAFAEHFVDVTLRALTTHHAAKNPWLFFMIGSSYFDHIPQYLLPPWIGLERPPHLPAIDFHNATMGSFLEEGESEFDFIHLSNVLDWANPEEAATLLSLVAKRLSPKGLVIVRQLNSSLDIESCGGSLQWDSSRGQALTTTERAFFYRRVLIAGHA